MTSIQRPKNRPLILILLSVFYWGTRIVHIDNDLPKWKTFYYSQVDELFYTIGAFNIISPPENIYKPIAQKDFLPVTLFEDGLTAASLSLFGDNYWGLRFPSILMGYLVLIMIFFMFEKRFGNKAAIIAAALLLLDVGFLLSNRIAEPTIFRLFGMLLVIYYLQSMVDKEIGLKEFFNAGFLSSFAFLFFYPTNFFIIPAAFIVLFGMFIYGRKRNAAGLKYLGAYLFSSLICAAIFLSISKYIMGGELERFTHMSDFSARVAVSGEKGFISMLKGFASNIKAVKEASFFYFNPFMLLLGVISLLYFILSAFKSFRKTRQITIDHIMAVFLVIFLCQTVFINDYPRKKLLMLFPFVIYSIIYGIGFLQKKFSSKKLLRYAFIVTIPVMIISLLLQVRYVYKNPTYNYKKAMIALKKYDGKIIAGNLSYAFRLYNNYTPLLNYYAYKYHNYTEHQRILQQVSADKNFAGSIYYGEEKYVEDLKEVNLCPAEKILPVNPNVPNLPVYMDTPCAIGADK